MYKLVLIMTALLLMEILALSVQLIIIEDHKKQRKERKTNGSSCSHRRGNRRNDSFSDNHSGCPGQEEQITYTIETQTTFEMEDSNLMKTINVMLDEGAIMPTRAHTADAGLDLYAPADIVVRANDSAVIDTGVHMEIPEGYVGMLKSNSGLNVKNNITNEGVIDAGYTGSIVVKLYNNGGVFTKLKKGSKISQLVILPIETPEPVLVDKFNDSERGNNGFGSTGE